MLYILYPIVAVCLMQIKVDKHPLHHFYIFRLIEENYHGAKSTICIAKYPIFMCFYSQESNTIIIYICKQ